MCAKVYGIGTLGCFTCRINIDEQMRMTQMCEKGGETSACVCEMEMHG